MNNNFVLQAINISKKFSEDSSLLLQNVNLEVRQGESIAIVGESGSGKSTFLQLCGLLDDDYKGDVIIDSETSYIISDDDKTALRRNKIGFVYQFHHLLSEFNVIENLIVPQLLLNVTWQVAQEKALHYLEKFHLLDKKNCLVHQLSGGERQRIAIIRSMINQPKLIIADEPTGNLDNDNAMLTLELLHEILRFCNAGMIIATHSLNIAKLCSRIMRLENGSLCQE